MSIDLLARTFVQSCRKFSESNYMHIHPFEHERILPARAALLCASLRRTARILTQHYDAALRPLNLTVTQFTILQALSLTGEISQGHLGQMLSMDSTTLTRTLEIMRQHCWIVGRAGKDRRQRQFSLSPAGKLEFHRALPYWESAQNRLRAKLGEKRWKSFFRLIHEITTKSVTE